MIEIAISSELAAEHPGFVADSARRGHRVALFESGEEVDESAASPQAGRD